MDYVDYVDPEAPIIGGLAVLLNKIRALVIRGMTEPMEVFRKSINDNQEATRTRKAMVPSQLGTAASCIVAVVNAERPVMAPVLR